MKKTVISFIYLISSLILISCQEQIPPPKPFGVLPTDRQMLWHDTEFYGFMHFTINTFTDKEWGFGDESPEMFNPTAFDAEQIAQTCKNAGMKGLILTTKHHDGFCLWPTKTTGHNISNSPYKEGKGDIVKEISEACRKHGLKFGVYLSPWDRNNANYGTPKYIELFREQLRELLTNYGDVFEVWFDGANGGTGYYGGTNEERKIDRLTYYDWENTWKLVRALQPNAALFSDLGPDTRWVGTEAGYSGDPCWHRFTPKGRKEGDPPANGQSRYWESLNGHREGEQWIPAEVDVSIRPGWFYHKHEDDKVKTLDHLLQIYYKSVGHGATLLLNLPPDRRGIIHENDVKALEKFREVLDQTFKTDLTKKATITASNTRGNTKKYSAENVLDNDQETYWTTDDEITSADLVIEFSEETAFNVVNIREYIKLGQRIWGWELDRWENGAWVTFAKGESIGHRRLWRGPLQVTTKLRIRITEAPVSPILSKVSVHQEPISLKSPKIIRDKDGIVTITSKGQVYYTTDGTEPAEPLQTYNLPFSYQGGGMVKAKMYYKGQWSETATINFSQSKNKWKVVDTKNESNVGKAIDENPRSVWKSTDGKNQIVIDMGEVLQVQAFTMLPHHAGLNEGLPTHYEFYLSQDNKTWELVSKGEFSNIINNPVKQHIGLKEKQPARYFKFKATKLAKENQAMLAEIGISIK